MRSVVAAVLILCTSCAEHAAGGRLQRDHGQTPDTLTALALKNEIYGRDRYKVLHLQMIDSFERIIRVLKNDTEIAAVALPRADDELKNFSLVGIEETQEGFSVTADWGGGNYFYTRVFYFAFRNDTFFLERIKVNNLRQPTEEEERRQEEIIPAIPIDEFDMREFLQNE